MKHVYCFGKGEADGTASMRDTLGGKGANLHEMTRLGIPVPPGFTISALLCSDYLENNSLPKDLKTQVEKAMERLEKDSGKRFGDPSNPLLVSVRSGAKFSMPGMMDTILNLGLNDETTIGLEEQTGNGAFAYDSYRRLIQMYGDVVFGVTGNADSDPFEEILHEAKTKNGITREVDLGRDALKEIAESFKTIVETNTGNPFPSDPWDQLWGAIEAVYQSWNARRARDYRKINGIPDDIGTAVNIVAMVYGNMGDDSATGVAFTRDPATGERKVFGEYLTNAQGEDVVAGIRTPEPLENMAKTHKEAHVQLLEIAESLEQHFRDMQDLEFTLERGTLYLLQARSGKRTTQSAVRIAVDMVDEGLIDKHEAVQRVDAEQLDQLLHPTVEPSAKCVVLATGLPASPGAAVGQAVFDADRAVEHAESGQSVILVRRETTPDDFHGMVAAAAILTERGGMTSHAAVVARGMGKSCVAGCKEIHVQEDAKRFHVDGKVISEGDWITLDGSSGRVLEGRAPLKTPEPDEYFDRLMTWADDFRLLRVRANADTPADAERAVSFGAEGIGLCRTEHMFFEGERIEVMREMIVAPGLEGRRNALAKLLPMQRDDFVGIFKAMAGRPVTIRLLDPPLHEFLPREDAEISEIAGDLGVTFERLKGFIGGMTEVNPMLGHRGCRLGITYPEITEMQAQAIIEAACIVKNEGIDVLPEIMIPLVSHFREFDHQAELVRRVADQVFNSMKTRVDYLLGTMIELPRAALTADRIAESAEFFSFGTNDLTQTTLGLSRDDSGRFLPLYQQMGIFKFDPFQSIDDDGVGQLMKTGITLGRATNPKLKVGICGEHGGDPRSVTFCNSLGMNYVSCSPFRVPIARLAAAQAALKQRDPDTPELDR